MADTNYVIDIATNMPEAGVTTAALDELSKSLLSAGASSETLELATIAVREQIIAAKAATQSANAALSEGNARYSELERSALNAAKAAEKAALKGVIEPGVAKRALEAQQALDAYSTELAALEQASASANTTLTGLGKTQESLKTLSKGVADATRAQAEAVRAAKDQEAQAAVEAARVATEAAKAQAAAVKAAQEEQAASVKAAQAEQAAAAAEAAKIATEAAKAQAAAIQAVEDELARATEQAAAEIEEALEEQEKARKKMADAAEAAQKKSIKEAESMVPLVKNFRDLGDAAGSSEGQMILAVGALTAVAAAVAVVTAALIAGVVALGAWAIGLADAKREAQLTTEAAEALSPGLKDLHGDFSALSEETGASAADMRGWVKQLEAAKVKADEIPDALRAVALSSAALGQEGVSEYFEQLKASKGAVDSLSHDVNSKLGGVVAKKMLGLSKQSEKLKKNLGDIFGGLDIDPVLAGFQTLVNLFDKNSEAGQTMRFLFETVFQPLIDQAENAGYVIEAFVLGFLIGLTKLYIVLKPAIKAVSEFFGFANPSLTDTLDLAKSAGEAIAPVFVGFLVLLGLLGAALVAIAAAPAALIGQFIYLGQVVQNLGVSIGQGLLKIIEEAKVFLSGVNLGEIGTQMIQGLAAGITGSAGAVLTAITGVAGNAIKAAKNLLGIKSPSKVFAEIGGYTSEGFAQGVDDSASMAQDAMAAMVAPPDPGSFDSAAAPNGGAGGSGSRGGRGAIDLSGATFNIYGVKDAEHASELFAEQLTKLLEGDAASISGEGADAA